VNIVVCVKRVPDTAAEKNLDPGDHTLDRDNVEAIVNPVDEYGVEEALKLKEAHGGEVTVLTMGPAGADKDALRKALAMGADKGVLVSDDALHGSDAMATAYTLSLALAQQDVDLVIMGSESTDARESVVPQAVAQFLAMPGLTFARKVEIGDGTVRVEREEEGGYTVLEAALPAVVSVVKGINEPRYATLKGIMGAKSKPVEVLSADDIGIEASEVGSAGSKVEVLSAEPRPPKAQGEIVTDEGDGAGKLADFLQTNKFI
jgi:electron transfer flavoprotein beta subunit